MSQSVNCETCDKEMPVGIVIRDDKNFCGLECWGRYQGRIDSREELFKSAYELRELWWMLETKAERCLQAMREVDPEKHISRDYDLRAFKDDGAYFEYQYDRDGDIYRLTIPWATLALPEADLIPTLQRERIEREEARLREQREAMQCRAERRKREEREHEIAQLKRLREKYPEVQS